MRGTKNYRRVASRRAVKSVWLWLIVFLFAPGAVSASPGETAAQTAGKAELLALHSADREAHFKHDVPRLTARMAPQIVDIRDGQINRVSREEVRQKFAEYFKHAEFSKWDDLEPPVVWVAPDGMSGWMAMRVRIAYTEMTDAGKKARDEVCAWMSAYEKRDGKWIMTAVTSTFGPEK